MRILKNLLLCISLFLPVIGSTCNISKFEEETLLSMLFEEFDQSENGWRKYSEPGCYSSLAKLLDTYMNKNAKILEDWQKIILTWHAGQLYAFNNDYELAKIRFEGAVNPEEADDAPTLWNAYVYATIAFLNDDMTKIIYYHDKIASGPMCDGDQNNLVIVDNLIRNLGQPYSIACCT